MSTAESLGTRKEHFSQTELSSLCQCSSTVLTLGELAKNSDNLPATVEILDGFYGFKSQLTISASDCLLILFVKQMKVVTMRDQAGVEYNYIPLGPAMKFGLLYGNKGVSEIFEKACDILSLSKLPYVVCTQRKVLSHGKQCGVQEGEVLILKTNQKGIRSGLACYSLSTNAEKVIAKECKGNFTTAPDT